jgi:DNA invertase Pin-like site-specific DNA recombinase
VVKHIEDPADDLIPCALYLRMSDDDQDMSIARQLRELTAYAARNRFRVVAVYKDEGKSGCKEQDKRIEFNRLLLDAPKREFRAVLCWNAARFARLDSIDGAFAKKILRQQGIYLQTASEGKIDWNTVQGRMFDFMLAEQANAYSHSLSKDSISGRLRAVDAGCWPYGSIPYGYDRLYASGATKHLVRRTDRFRKPRGWTLRLVVNEAEAAVVRRIFQLFVERVWSRRQIAMQLNRERIPAPDNLPGAQKLGWTSDTVGTVLRHKAYIGIAEMGHRKPTSKEALNRIPPTAKRGCCPAIVDEPVFDRAQDRLEQRANSGKRQQSARAGLLSGFLVCHHCGYRMRKEQRGAGATYYVCDSPGRRPNLGCAQWRVGEADLLPLVVQEVVRVVDAEILQALDSRPRSGEPINRADLLTAHVESLRGQVATAARRCVTEQDDDLAGLLREQLRELRRELAEAEAALQVAQAMDDKGGVQSFAEWWHGQKRNIQTFLSVRDHTLEAPAGHREFWQDFSKPEQYDPPAIDTPAGQAKQNADSFVIVLPADEAGKPNVNQATAALGFGDEMAKATTCYFDQDGFRALLERLGVSARVAFVPTKKKVGNKKWDADFAALTIDMTWNGEPNHDVQERTGTC